MRTVQLGVVVAAVALASACSAGGPSESDAEVSCEERVESQLRSPSSADFTGTTATEVTESEYRVTGEVDAENAFGAEIRSSFTCTVQFRDDGTYARVDQLTQR
jgi:hypothetical protein